MAFIGNTPTTQAFTPAIDYFSGNGSTVAFTLSRTVASVAQVQAVVENVPQAPGDAFTVLNNTITFTSAPPLGANNIYVYYTSPITQVITPGQATVGTAQLVDGSVTTAKMASNAVAPNAANSTTQAAKTSDTTIATTAFVDRLRSMLAPSTGTGGGTAVVGDRGSLLSVTAGVTVPASVFAANDVFSIYNNSASNITITQGAGFTLRQAGTANTGNRTLAQRGLATVVFISATEAVISGGGLT